LYEKNNNINKSCDKIHTNFKISTIYLKSDTSDIEYLESMCLDAARCAPYMIWPGLFASSVIFGLYLFDMAWDTEDNAVAVPITLLVLNMVVTTVLCVLFFRAKNKVEAELMDRYKQSLELVDVSSTVFVSGNEDTVAALDGNCVRSDGSDHGGGIDIRLELLSPIVVSSVSVSVSQPSGPSSSSGTGGGNREEGSDQSVVNPVHHAP
jgi:hypothetical protein